MARRPFAPLSVRSAILIGAILIGAFLIGAILIGAFLIGSVPAMASERERHEDTHLPRSCSASHLAVVREQTLRSAGARAPQQAWALTQALLCGRGAAATRLIRRHAPQRVAYEAYGLGDDPGPFTTLRPRTALHPIAQPSWAATMEVRGEELLLWYRPAEICSGVFRLRFVGSHWLIVGAGEACD